MASITKRINKYRVRIRIKGFPEATASFHTLDQARRWAVKTETAIHERKYFGEGLYYTLNDIIDQYLENEAPIRLNPKSYRSTTENLKHWQSTLGTSLMNHVRPRDILDVRSKLLSTHKPATINRIEATLSAVFTYAVEREIVAENPCRKIRSLTIPTRRNRVLTKDEEPQLFGALWKIDIPTYIASRFALATGARQSEILNWRPAHLDCARQTITFYRTKNKSDRTIPLADYWYQFLIKKGADFRFGYKQPAWYAAVKEKNLENLHFHDLRHTYVTRMIAAGHNAMQVATLVGHSYATMTAYYCHLDVDDLRHLVQ